jgi:DNA segregation ATPase FtsK/SpoIIIE, S-DNA-T family
MAQESKNPLTEVRDSVKHIWIHRRGNEAYAGVYDTMAALYKPDLKPRITKQIKNTPDSKEFLIHLPPGLAYSEFKRKEQIFADAVGGTVQISKRGRTVTMVVSTTQIKSNYPYSFDPTKNKDLFLPVHFGFSAVGELVKDLSAMPNLIIAGHPGAGKTNFLHGLIYGLLLAGTVNPCSRVVPCVIDLKRLEFSYLQPYGLVITELYQAKKLLTGINKELNKRLDILEGVKVKKIQTYLKRGHEMPFILLVIDELAEMQDEECQTLLNRALRLGRAAGICIVCATQRPSSTMFKAFGDSKAMFAGTMCFHVRDAINSQMLLDNDRAALIPTVKGRAVFQWDDELESQTMYFPVEEDEKLEDLLARLDKSLNFVEVIERHGSLQPPKMLPPR